MTAARSAGRPRREIAAVLLAVLACGAGAQYPATPLSAQFAQPNAALGSAIDLVGMRLIVGAPHETIDHPAPQTDVLAAGGAYIYRHSGSVWSFEGHVRAADAKALDHFGSATAVWGGLAICGAPDVDLGGFGGQGVAYAFAQVQGQWTQVQKLVPSASQDGAQFGFAVDMNAAYAVVGEPYWVDGSLATGRAWLFQKDASGWNEVMPLALPATTGARVGWSVGLGDSVLAVGAWGAKIASPKTTGITGIWRLAGGSWSLETTLAGDDPAEADKFGYALGVSGQHVAIAAPGDDDAGLDAGAVYVFRDDPGGWTLEAKLVPCGPAPGEGFGSSLSLGGETLVVGSPGADVGGLDRGAVHVFRRGPDGWKPVTRWIAAEAAAGDEFGIAVAVSGDLGAVGARYHDPGVPDAGLCLTATGLAAIPAWGDLAGGTPGGSAYLAGSGGTSPGASFVLDLSGAPASSPTTMVVGLGLLCLPLKGTWLVPTPDLLVSGLVTDAVGGLSLGGAWPADMPSGLDLRIQAYVQDGLSPAPAASNGINVHVP